MLRRKKKTPVSAALDQDLTFLTRAEADEVRRLVRATFAARGREVDVFGGHVRDDHGTKFTLWNVAATCHANRARRRSWPKIIDEHVRRVTEAAGGQPFRGLSAAQALSRTYARILAADALPDWHGYSYVRELAPGLKEALSLDCPETVAFFGDAEVERFGGAEDLRRAGLANLRALPVEHIRRLHAPDGGGFTVVHGESIYTSARALVMPDLIARAGGPADLSNGVLVGMASRYQVAVHPIRDATVLSSLQHMAKFTALGYQDTPGPLSPHVFWWHDGQWEQLTAINADNGIVVTVSDEFASILEEVADRPGP